MQRAYAMASLEPGEEFSESDSWFIEWKKSFDTDEWWTSRAQVPKQLGTKEEVCGNEEVHVDAHGYVKGLVLAVCRAFQRGELRSSHHTEVAAYMEAASQAGSMEEGVVQAAVAAVAGAQAGSKAVAGRRRAQRQKRGGRRARRQ
eukprot:jgi/Chrzof1/6371/Cz18g06040.t1